jgi:hypothetical protein
LYDKSTNFPKFILILDCNFWLNHKLINHENGPGKKKHFVFDCIDCPVDWFSAVGQRGETEHKG